MSYTYRGTGKAPKMATGRTPCRCAAASPILYCALHEAAPELVARLKEWERNIPRMANETPAEGSLRARTLRLIAHAEGRG